jgi:glycosyltransferase involved in cell wall biosynthesis
VTAVSVIIPAYNAEDTLGAQLEALAGQHRHDLAWEVIVADNGSTDQTAAVAGSFSKRLPLRVVDASHRRGPSTARNTGVAHARGDVLLFCDADDVVLPGWLESMMACVAPRQVAVGSFRLIDASATEVPTDWTATQRGLPLYLGQLPLTYSSNMGLTKDDFDRLGGFDESLRCGEDADLGIRLQASGCEIEWCPQARVVMRNRASARKQFRQFVEYGRWDVAVYKKHRGGTLRRPPLSDALRDYASLVINVGRLLHPHQRRSWIVTAGQRLGRLVGSIRERVFLP